MRLAKWYHFHNLVCEVYWLVDRVGIWYEWLLFGLMLALAEMWHMFMFKFQSCINVDTSGRTVFEVEQYWRGEIDHLSNSDSKQFFGGGALAS